jgi:hypothetical protein
MNPRRRRTVQAALFRREYSFVHQWDRARYDATYLRLGLSEAQVQANAIAYLRARWRAEVTELDVGDARFRGRAKGIIRAVGGDPRLLNARGGKNRRGIVDLAVTFPHLGGRAAWFEVKRPEHLTPSRATGRLIQAAEPGAATPEQLDFLDRQQKHGAIVGVIWQDRDLDALVPAAALGAA